MNHRQANHGALHFTDPREFATPLTEAEEIEQALAVLADEPLRRPQVSDWLPLIDCVPYGAGFSLEAKTPAIHAFLRFDPSTSQQGDYKIRVLRKLPEENGRIVKITRVPEENLWMHRFAALQGFPNRFLVETSDFMGKMRLWFVGIKSTRKIQPDSN